MPSGRELSASNVKVFKGWVRERCTANYWSDYIYRDQPNRKKMAAECDFAKSVLRQNPMVKKKLERLERRLRRIGALSPLENRRSAQNDFEAAQAAVDLRIISLNNQNEQYSRTLDKQNVALCGENRALRGENHTL